MKLSEKSRKLLRKVYRILGVTTVALVVQACYGSPPAYYEDTESYETPRNLEENYSNEEDTN